MTYAQTSAGKHVSSNSACVRCKRYTKDAVFGLAQMTCIMTLHNFPLFFVPNIISDGPTIGLSIGQLKTALFLNNYINFEYQIVVCTKISISQ